MADQPKLTRIGLAGLAVMGQNLALNIAEKGFPISVYNRSTSKVDETVERAKKEGNLPVFGFHDPESFVNSIQKPRVIIMLVKAGAPVDQTIKTLSQFMEKGDCIIDGGNEWYENTERREKAMSELGLLYLGMGVSGGEEGARNGPSMMPGGSIEAYKYIEDIVLKVAAQVDSGPCVTYIGSGGSGNFVKMVHNGIEYGDMQLISEAYDVLKSVGKLSNEELHDVFTEWNKGELQSFLIEITADIFGIKDDKGDGYLVDKVLDKTGMKGTGKWTVQQAADLSIAAPTIAASLDSRFLSGLKDERVSASKIFKAGGLSDILPADENLEKEKLIHDVRQALYASKICSYAQGMNLIRAKSSEKGWNLKLGELARIWKGGCIIRAIFLDRIKQAYDRNPELANLLVDPEFAKEMVDRQAAWRRVVCLAINSGVSTPGMSSSLAYFDSYRRERLPANLIKPTYKHTSFHQPNYFPLKLTPPSQTLNATMSAAAMSAMGYTSSKDFTRFNTHIPIQSFHFNPSISLSIRTNLGSLRQSFVLKRNKGDNFPLLLAFSGEGGDGNGVGNGNNSGGGGGGGGDGGDGKENEALWVLAEAGRSVDSIPADLVAAIRAGRIPGSVVKRYLELETSPFLRWLMQFGGFKERLLADDLFLAKVAMECGVGMFTKTAAEYEKRKENFTKELEIVFADVVMAVIADFMLVYLPAPTISLRPPISLNAGRIAKFFYNCPDNAFQTALGGTSYTLLQRLGAIARNGTKLFAVGTASSLVGTVMTNTLINAKKAVQKSSDEELENIPVLSTSVGYGVYMAISSNLRYQLLAGVVEQRLLEPLLHQHKLMLSAACFIVRTGNTYLGSLLWVDYARLIGLQKAHDVEQVSS